MNAVWIDVPSSFLEERRQLGHDKRDELWEGVLHMVPTAMFNHGRLVVNLFLAFRRVAAKRGLVALPDGVGLYAPDVAPKSWRIPDVSLSRPEHESKRGIEGAELVVEVRSPNDESCAKLPFYARVGVREVWIIVPATRTPQIFTIVDDAFAIVPPVGGVHHSPLLGVTLEVVPGETAPLLRLTDGDDVTDV